MLISTCLMETKQSWLADLLNEKGLSQADLHRLTKISEGHISKVLSGERSMGEKSILILARALKIPPEDAFRRAGLLPAVEEATEQTERLLFIYHELAPSSRQDLLDYAEFLLRRK